VQIVISSGIYRHVVRWKLSSVSEESLPQSSGLKGKDKQETSIMQAANMEAKCSSETSVDFQQRYIPKDRTRHNHPCENLKSYTNKWIRTW
jgi:hypothetical protein